MKEELLDKLNDATADDCIAMVQSCAGARAIAESITAMRPYVSWDTLVAATHDAWQDEPEDVVREAAATHPRIGATGATSAWSQEEQAGAQNASARTRAALQEANDAYFEKFGFSFIVCATGKSADEMLALVKQRLNNAPQNEWKNTRDELRKITLIRLQKLLQTP